MNLWVWETADRLSAKRKEKSLLECLCHHCFVWEKFPQCRLVVFSQASEQVIKIKSAKFDPTNEYFKSRKYKNKNRGREKSAVKTKKLEASFLKRLRARLRNQTKFSRRFFFPSFCGIKLKTARKRTKHIVFGVLETRENLSICDRNGSNAK